MSDHHGQLVDKILKSLLHVSSTFDKKSRINLPYIEFLFYIRSLSRETYEDDRFDRFFKEVVFMGHTEAAKWALKVGGPKVEKIIPDVLTQAVHFFGNFAAAQTLLKLGLITFTQEEKDHCLRQAMDKCMWTSTFFAENIKAWIKFGGRIDNNFLDKKLRVVAELECIDVSEEDKVLAGFYPQERLNQNLMSAVSDGNLTQAKLWQLLGGKAATSEIEERIEHHYRNNPSRMLSYWC